MTKIFFKNIVFILIGMYQFLGVAQNNAITFNFDKSNSQSTHTNIQNSIIYSNNLGYGFDFNTGDNAQFNGTNLYGEENVYFSIKLPEGNYQIDITFGGSKASLSTIKAESRRLMVNQLFVDANKEFTKSFTVNVRSSKINDHQKIKLKKRELLHLNWDNKLTLEFLGNFAIKNIKITPVNNAKTIFLAGDSTVADQDLEPWASWGQFFTNYVNSNVVVANYASSGASLGSFKNRNRFEKILYSLRKDDFVFIEFGHNDEKIKGEGNGAWGLYMNLLKEFVTKIRQKGGIPILCTPTQRRLFYNNGKLKPTHGEFPDAMRKVAEDLDVYLIDVTKITTKMYETWGIENSKNAFVHYAANTFPGQTTELKDNTHFNSFGANEIAISIVQTIKNLNLPISKLLKKDIKYYNENDPHNFKNWTLPISAKFENTKPDGN
ncbi:rhamnogalacturonan acetylesterase [Polaribacter reichenbachii]|nr:rhamnogalacturonan acetylesterase [Polaribacter reichenbachii]AUC20563.1 rhamnogalacturonan acetylesterase [Polaribacter reichenbachii]